MLSVSQSRSALPAPHRRYRPAHRRRRTRNHPGEPPDCRPTSMEGLPAAVGFSVAPVQHDAAPITAPPTPELGPVRELHPLDDIAQSSTKGLESVRGLRLRHGQAKQCLHRGSISDHLRDLVSKIDVDECEADGENAFFVADLSEVYRQHLRWMRALPRVIPFYAVKCNPDPVVLRLLAALGAGFDCASNGEIQSVLDMGVSASRIIYANPCKAASFVRNAAAQGVGLTTFDNADELVKMKRFHPSCKLVVRILTDDSKSVCQLGLKFGAPLDSVPALLAKARELELDVVGVSFHVGSGCYDPMAFHDAIRRARRAFDMGRDAGYTFDLLDVGGGYAHDNFETIADVLRPAIDQEFPDRDFAPGGRRVEGKPHGLRIIAEPGRYYVQRAFVLAANIIARRDGRGPGENDQPEEQISGTQEAGICASGDDDESKPDVMFYQNDGVYGAFNCILFDHQEVFPKVLTLGRRFAYRPELPSPGVEADVACVRASLWGPTCDSIDQIRARVALPAALSVSDYLAFEDMGAYTLCAASSFNGMTPSRVARYLSGERLDEALAVESLLCDGGADVAEVA